MTLMTAKTYVFTHARAHMSGIWLSPVTKRHASSIFKEAKLSTTYQSALYQRTQLGIHVNAMAEDNDHNSIIAQLTDFAPMVASLGKGERGALHTQFRKFRGRWYCDIRFHIANGDNILCPTVDGLSLSPSMIGEAIRALQEAEKAATACGLL